MYHNGFRHGYSSNTQVLEVMDDFTSFMNPADDSICIYLDFAKAFDKVFLSERNNEL